MPTIDRYQAVYTTLAENDPNNLSLSHICQTEIGQSGQILTQFANHSHMYIYIYIYILTHTHHIQYSLSFNKRMGGVIKNNKPEPFIPNRFRQLVKRNAGGDKDSKLQKLGLSFIQQTIP